MAIVVFALSGQAMAQKDKNILLKVPMAYPSKLPGLGTTIIWMSERIELLSGGTIKIKVFEPGELIPAFEGLDAVHAGKVKLFMAFPDIGPGNFRPPTSSRRFPSAPRPRNTWPGSITETG